jgi:hypothetical protein
MPSKAIIGSPGAHSTLFVDPRDGVFAKPDHPSLKAREPSGLTQFVFIQYPACAGLGANAVAAASSAASRRERRHGAFHSRCILFPIVSV